MVSGGWNPAVHLASMSGAPLAWDEALLAFVPGALVQRERSAGACRGVHGIGAAVLAEARGEPVSRVGLPRFRPYTAPIT